MSVYEKNQLIAIIALLLFFLACSVSATVSSSDYSNGGTLFSASHASYEIEGDGYYQHGGISSRVTTNGRSALDRTIEMSGAKTIEQNSYMQVTDGTMIVNEAGAVWSSQTNISDTDCVYGSIADQGSTTAGRYPETNAAQSYIGIIGNGTGTEYQSQLIVDDKLLAMSMSGITPHGLTWADSSGKYELGLSKNITERQYLYTQENRLISVDHDGEIANAVESFLWDIIQEDIINGTVNETEVSI